MKLSGSNNYNKNSKLFARILAIVLAALMVLGSMTYIIMMLTTLS